jgi:hypothetical protein
MNQLVAHLQNQLSVEREGTTKSQQVMSAHSLVPRHLLHRTFFWMAKSLSFHTTMEFIEGVKSFIIQAPGSNSLSAFTQGVFLFNVVEPLAAHPTFYQSLS